MRRAYYSLPLLGLSLVLAIGLTGAFFSDTETSTGNTFQAGAIDLKVDNTSYYNGVFNPATSWGHRISTFPIPPRVLTNSLIFKTLNPATGAKTPSA
jgi:predicted ribosomally synthesized peptide with SipW-like signal peptide